MDNQLQFPLAYETNPDYAGELFHYTTAEGLRGLLTKKKLWATRSDFLNDSEEREGFFRYRLPILVSGVVTKQLGCSPAQEQEEAQAKLVQFLRDLVLHDDPAYIVSLCNGAKFDSENGLLSQWRAYGTDGGYAVVFDTERLIQALKSERLSFDYGMLDMDAVAYYSNDGNVHSSHPRISQYEELLVQELNLEKTKAGFILYEALTLLSTLYKNRGFHEEDEIRIVAVPRTMSTRTLISIGMKKPVEDFLPRKAIEFRSRDGLLLPYLELPLAPELESPSLPIKRIIVGPHPDADRRTEAANAMLTELNIDAKAYKSGIPYVK
jgi:hypothetical protein